MSTPSNAARFPAAANWRSRYGAFPHEAGTRFVLRSPNFQPALVLFDDPGSDVPSRRIPFTERFGDAWTLDLADVGPGQAYAYAKAGESDDSAWFVDPHATEITGRTTWAEPGARDKGVVHASNFDWGDDAPPNIAMRDSVVYEAHLHGMTARERGTDVSPFLAFIDQIPHLVDLGITAVEFLPIQHFNELEYEHPELDDERAGLRNFWGYSTLAFFAPMSRYGAPNELKQLVRALHAAGIEIWLDVVYNHTGENRALPPYSLSALDEPTFYILEKSGRHCNYSGCGNTVNCNHPVVAEFILDSLRHWVTEYHIDGFRFDLASILCRDVDGRLLKRPPLVAAIDADPVLRGTKVIAEAWDAAGAYQVGSFPGKRWSEWNGKYRDDVRAFWLDKSAPPGPRLSALATRLTGSDDIYGRHQLGPLASVNFITCHDGFTLRDLVSFSKKHNEGNREGNRDGESHNHSFNFGVEGLSDDPEISARRYRMQKNLLATLLFSHGVPMLTAGDEFGRTQLGNNNGYCQDNEIGWVDLSLKDSHGDLIGFVRKALALRREFLVLRSGTFVGAAGRGKDRDAIEWIGLKGKPVNWASDRAFGVVLHGEPGVVLLFNNQEKPAIFHHGADTLLLASGDGVRNAEGTWTLPSETMAVLSALSPS